MNAEQVACHELVLGVLCGGISVYSLNLISHTMGFVIIECTSFVCYNISYRTSLSRSFGIYFYGTVGVCPVFSESLLVAWLLRCVVKCRGLVWLHSKASLNWPPVIQMETGLMTLGINTEQKMEMINLGGFTFDQNPIFVYHISAPFHVYALVQWLFTESPWCRVCFRKTCLFAIGTVVEFSSQSLWDLDRSLLVGIFCFSCILQLLRNVPV